MLGFQIVFIEGIYKPSSLSLDKSKFVHMIICLGKVNNTFSFYVYPIGYIFDPIARASFIFAIYLFSIAIVNCYYINALLLLLQYSMYYASLNMSV